MKKLVYISHPSSGLESNTKKIEDIISTLYSYEEIRNKYTFVSPVHTYGFMYNDVDYNLGLQFCLDLLEHCEEIWVFGDYKVSTGCKKEIEYAKKLGIKLRIFDVDSSEETKKLVESGEYYRSKHKELESPTVNKVYSRTKMAYCLIDANLIELNENNIKNYIMSHILYSDINSALRYCKEKGNNNDLVIIEVELDTSKVFDMTCNYDMQLYHNYNKYRGYTDLSDRFKIDWFMRDMSDTFNCIRRVKEVKSLFKPINIPNEIIEAYSIYSFDCVRRVKWFNSQTKGVIDSYFIIGDLS